MRGRHSPSQFFNINNTKHSSALPIPIPTSISKDNPFPASSLCGSLGLLGSDLCLGVMRLTLLDVNRASGSLSFLGSDLRLGVMRLTLLDVNRASGNLGLGFLRRNLCFRVVWLAGFNCLMVSLSFLKFQREGLTVFEVTASSCLCLFGCNLSLFVESE
jgi:hypothetical protein